MTDDLRETVDALQERVRRLEKIVEQDDTNHSPEAEATQTARYDRYDRRVIDELTNSEVVTLKRLKTLYNAAGVRDEKKIKQRIESLTSRGVLTPASGVGRWQYTGEQE